MNQVNERIDRTALKFNQGSIVVLTGIGFLLNNYWLPMAVGTVLLIDTLFPGTGLFKLLYKNFLKPLRLLNPHIYNESRTPHQFAQGMGGVCLILSFLLLKYMDLEFWGWSLSFIVMLFAFVNVAFNFCAGCFIYFQIEKLKPCLNSLLSEKRNV